LPLFDAVYGAAVMNYYFTAHLRTLDCLLVESSNKERLDCKVTWHMTCIFQHSAVKTGLDTHTSSTRQTACMMATNNT